MQLLWLLGFLCVASASSVPPKIICPQNEEYKDCAVSPCINTCARPNISIMCKAPCKPGCGCIKDYLRNTKGICVPPRKCDVCGKNEIFSLTDKNECQNTCEDPTKRKTCVSDKIIPGCVCKIGFFRNLKNECVPPQECENYTPPLNKTCPRTGLPYCSCHLLKFYDGLN